ncbi:hypothetical protein [Halorarum salinum]|uniref:Uncharacterized protein n=1 Tax=Halorarum salinum TaxID=2743089 RepID=A0A7D5Q8Y2_9EURY|nr:hypothetical protein [Halobaculum salinum]QLG61277.1 hypothetical protein HUG12_05825 [Halobaculum salinum]
MHRPAIDDAVIEAVAANTDFEPSDVKVGLRTLHDAVRDRLAEEFAAARDPEGPDHLLLSGPDAAWFAFGFRELESALADAGYEVDEDLLAAAAATNLRAFQEAEGRTVSFSRSLARTYEAPFLYPVRVNKPEPWRAAERHAFATVADLLLAGFAPDAAVDAWAVESMGLPAAEWAERRGVAAASVREAAERARERHGTPGKRVDPADDVAAPPTDEAPAESVYDPGTDRLFVPTDERRAARGGGDLLADDAPGET